MATLKPNKKPTVSKPSEDDLDEARPLAASPEVDEEAAPVVEEVPDVTPVKAKPAKSAAVPRVDVSQSDRDDEVLITMYETISPAPRVGTFNIQLMLGLSQLEERKNYRLPKFVAEVLVDAKKAEYLQLN